jgi:peptidoglycan-associated lipoprotein
MNDGSVFRRCAVVVGLLLITGVSLGAGFESRACAQATMPSHNPEFSQNVKEVFFPFNIYNKVIDRDVLNADAAWLKQHPDAQLWIQGYADIRGDIVYNLVLSYRRAQWVKSEFMKQGVEESRIGFATGWGKLYPVCEKKDEQCFQQNRRVDAIPPDIFTLASAGQ